MRKPTLILLALLAALLAPARGQDRERQIAIQRLGLKQKDAVDRLDSLLKRVGILIEDLRGMGDEEKAKADLLEQALLIVSAENIETNVLKGSGENQVVLGDLKRAMEALARGLNRKEFRVEDVQELAMRVVDKLDDVVQKLIGAADLKTLEARERALMDMRSAVREAAAKQSELKRETQAAVPRTEAEKTARSVARDLERLSKTIEDIDRAAERELRQVDEAREKAARLEALLARQKRLRRETAVRTLFPLPQPTVTDLASGQRSRSARNVARPARSIRSNPET